MHDSGHNVKTVECNDGPDSLIIKAYLSKDIPLAHGKHGKIFFLLK
jgi:hypothetical protein